MALVRMADEARDMFRDFAERNGVSVSSLLEAIARRLPPPGKPSPHHAEVISEARAIDAERRRRD